MADGLLSGLLGGGNTTNLGGIDLNQLVRPPDPLGAALAEMSQRFATAGQASRLPVSTLGAIGSALGGAGAAAQTQQTQYLDQAIKLQALKQSYMKMGYGENFAAILAQAKAQELARQAGGAAPAVPAAVPGSATPAPGAPAAPAAVPGVPGSATPAPGAPAATPGPILLPGDVGAGGEYGAGQGTGAPPGFTPSILPPGSPGTVTIDGRTYTPPGAAPLKTTGLLGDSSTADASGLDSVIGGAGAATMPNPFRLASLVGSAGDGSGSGAGADPLSLIAKYESGGRNIRQQVVPESVSSASGPWQMLDSTFHETAKKAGIDVSKYDSAKDAPIETQRAVAQALYDEKGFAPWANYNPKLAAAIGGGTPTGGTASPVSALRGLLAGSDGGSADPLAGLLALARGSSSDKGGGDEDPLAGLLKPQDEVIPSGGELPAGMLQKAALGANNAGYLIPNILPPGGNAAFPALPVTGSNQIPIAGPGAPDTVIRGEPPADAQQVGDRLIGGPSTQQRGSMMQLAQYAPGGGAARGAAPAGGAAPDLQAMINGLMQQQATSTGGVIPGLGMTPQMAAIADAYAELAGFGNPLKGLLDTYYKNPQYLQDAARATALGQAQTNLQYGPLTAGLTAGAQAAAQQPYELQKIFGKTQAELAAEWDKPQRVVFTDAQGNPHEQFISPRQLAGGAPPGVLGTGTQGTGGQGTAPPPLTGPQTGLGPIGQARVELDKGMATAAATTAATGQQLAPILDEVIRIANQTPQGIAGPIGADLAARVAPFFPVSASLSNAELMRSLTQQLIPTVRQPGSQSNKEMEVYQLAVPGLAQSAIGRVQIASINKAMINRASDIAALRRDNIGAPDLSQKLAELDNKPLFSDQQRAIMQAGTGRPIDKAAYDLLPPGMLYTDPMGTKRTKPTAP